MNASREMATIILMIAACAHVPPASPEQAQPAAPSTPAPEETHGDARPLPDIPALLRDVVKNQQALEELRRQYTSHLAEEEDKVDSDGNVKSRTVKDYDIFYIGDEEVLHLLAKDGKPLEGDEKRDEDEKFDKQFDKLKKQQAELAADPKKREKKEEEDEAELSDFLRAELFTNPRRETFQGREVIAFDAAGNPDYKPKKRIDAIIQKLGGTMWVDENARQVVRLEARFTDSVKIGGGLVASLAKGSNFVFEQQEINGEVWLPSYVEVHLSGRIAFVKLKQNFVDRYSNYRKFGSSVTLGATTPQP